jgi:hypothetical protein
VKRDVAEQLQLMALSVQARMRETLDYAGDHCSPEDVTRIGMVAGRVISALIDGILEPIQAEHADLIPKGMKGPYVVDPTKLGAPIYQRDPASIVADSRDDPDLTTEQLHAVGALSTTEIDATDAALMAEVTGRWQKVARIVARAMDSAGDRRHAGVPDLYFAERVRELERRGLIESVGNTRR